ncbi:MAG: Uma2 family endonuclease [Halothiobacillaceae bacterium]
MPCRPPPPSTHQAVRHKIAWVLQEQLRGCKAYQALLPVDWRISEDTILQPDNLVICPPAEGAYLTRAPVLIFEVLCKSTALKDQNTKYEIYQHEGVKYYVLVAPEDRTAKIFTSSMAATRSWRTSATKRSISTSVLARSISISH